MRACQLPAQGAEHGRQSATARELIAVAERFAWRARLPLVLVICGLPASGKSHLAAALAERSGLPHRSSDVTRKQLAGLSSTQRAPVDRYSAEWSARTYAELAARATEALATSGGAIVDATFRRVADRRAFASGLGESVPLLFLEGQAPREVLLERAGRRDQDAARISDADAALVAREYQRWEPLDEVPGRAHLVLRTDRSTDEIIGDLLALLDRRLLRANASCQ